MDTILDRQRLLHEERERVENAMSAEMMAKKSTNRDQINTDHRINGLKARYMACSRKLAELYEDKSGDRRQEIEELRASNDNSDRQQESRQAFSKFYMVLKKLRDSQGKHQEDQIIPMSLEFEEMERARDPANVNPMAKLNENLVDFTDEEGYGRHLDLIKIHEQYLNLKNVEKIDYLTYLDRFDKLYDIPREQKFSAYYKAYLEALIAYFRDYCQRFKPLLDVKDFEDRVVADFHQQWLDGIFSGWTTGELTQGLSQGEPDQSNGDLSIDLDQYDAKEELNSLGMDRLKAALMSRGLKCGGTLEERANRLWQTKGKSDNEIDESLKAKGAKKWGGLKKSASRHPEKMKDIAKLEAIVYRFVELLEENKLATIENVQRKQSRTAGEREDSDEELSDGDLGDDDDTEVIYNPKNLPLNWDGKPIPYWLYKLHGLNITYTCEICGNATYKGPKTFQRHFVEGRHHHGMRCLGIPNTGHFAYITQIEDAINLWEKLKNEKQKDKHEPSNEEEYEDSQGNVVNKKTYEDLKRQGLL